MELLKERIIRDGKTIGNHIVKVDSFINHQVDVKLFNEIGMEFRRRFEGARVDKILTIETSGIAVAAIASQYFDYAPVVFAKKTESVTLDDNTYNAEVHSYTKNKTYTIRVSKNFIGEGDNVLIIDDFLANGQAVLGLINIIEQAGAKAVGAGIVIEKGFQPGRSVIEERNVRVESLAIVDRIDDNMIYFK